MPRHPRDIVPIDNKEDLLLAIYDAIEGLRADLSGSVAESSARTSAAPATGVESEPAPVAAPQKKRPARKKKTTSRKKA